MSEPSVLTYARYFKLTRDHRADDPLDAVNTILASPSALIAPDQPDQGVLNLVKKFKTAAEEYITLANDDPLPVSKDVTHYLDTCSKYDIGDLNQLYKDLLPDPYRLQSLRFEIPLLITGGGDVRRDVRKIRRSRNPDSIINDFIQDKEDEKDESPEDNRIMSSTLSAEILEWSQRELRAAMLTEKMIITQDALKYLKDALSTPIDSQYIWDTMQDLLPRVTTHVSDNTFPISPDDFDLGEEDDTPNLSELPERDEIKLDELTPAVKQELDLLGRLETAVDEEFFLESTQVDREMEELLQQSTHHNTQDLDVLISPRSSDESSDELPVAKKRKLEHNFDDHLVALEASQDAPRNMTMTLNDLKVHVPHILEPLSFKIPDIDIPGLIALVDNREPPDRVMLTAPFHIPTMHEAICNSMPALSKTYERYLVDGKNIKSSDKHLWKEPGLRLLDLDDIDEKDVASDDFDIEDLDEKDFMIVKPHDESLPHLTKPVNNVPVLTANRSEPDKTKYRSSDIPNGQFPLNSTESNRELPHTKTDHLATSSNTIDPKISKQTMQFTVSELRRQPQSTADYHQPKQTTTLSQSCKRGTFMDNTVSSQRQPVMNHKVTNSRSLLPKRKDGRPAPNIAVKKEHKLNDSLASFLDLRGKQFILPTPKQEAEGMVDIIDDPIQSTQDPPVEEWPKEAQSMVPSLTGPVEVIQHEILPPVTPLQESRTVVMNSNLLRTRRPLIQFLERPDERDLTLIYRECDVNHIRGPDIILNPTTCLIIVNLQSLNQRSLPGQKSATGLSPAHDQVACLAQSYSQVMILVHHVQSTDRESQVKTTSVQASFAAFCLEVSRTMSLSLSSSSSYKQIQPYWLPCADPGSISKVVNAWVWQIIAVHAYRNADRISSKSSPQSSSDLALAVLIDDQTLWEVFLCKAGLNPMAAQVVLGSLRKPNGRDGEASNADEGQVAPTWGLRKLIAMGSRERVRLFGGLIGHDAVKYLNEVFSNAGPVK